MDDDKELLLKQLHSANADVRDEATQRLWQLFFGAAGPEAELRVLTAEQAIERGSYAEAQIMLDDLVLDFPAFAEGWNRRATLRYLLKQYAASVEDCRVVVRLEPNHFGAWHGMGLCYLSLNRFTDALQAFKHALEIQPFAETNQQLLAQCFAKLN